MQIVRRAAPLGAAVADPARRPFVIVGDGAFQMTGAELATLARLGIDAIVLVLNNRNYKMLEVMDQPREYYHLEPWDYVAVARAQGAAGERATTAAELCAALARAEERIRGCLTANLDSHDGILAIQKRKNAQYQIAGAEQFGVCRSFRFG